MKTFFLSFLFLGDAPTLTRAGDITMNGAWALDHTRSDSLVPMLEACGAPRFISKVLARHMDKDVLHFHRNEKSVLLKYKQDHGRLPIKLPSDFSYEVDKIVCIPTPNGDQKTRVIDMKDATSCKMIRYGPRKGETVEDNFEMDGEHSMIYRVLHTSPKGQVTQVQRVFSKVLDN